MIDFRLPAAAVSGDYRALVRLSVIESFPPRFWWTSMTFDVTTP